MISLAVPAAGWVVWVTRRLRHIQISTSFTTRPTGLDRKTVRKYLARGLETPTYKSREPRARVIDEFAKYLRERIAAYPGLTAKRLMREIRARGYEGGYTSVKDESVRSSVYAAFGPC